MHLLTGTKKSFSASELQRQLGHKRFQPVWEMLHRLRSVMGKRDSQYQLSGQVEIDNAVITTLIPEDPKNEKNGRGAGSQRKSKVLVMTESQTVDNSKPTRPPKKVNHIKMRVVTSRATEIIKEQVDGKQTEIQSDDSTAFKKLKDAAKSHQTQIIHPEDLPKMFLWVHICIGNVKRLLLYMHHQLKTEYLQYYPD